MEDLGKDSRRASVHHFSLMNSLLAVLNTSKHDSTESVLARYFLAHFDDLRHLNVYDVAEACFTSRSGIRRFCQSIGLDNFSDLKSYAWEWDDHRKLFLEYADHSDFRAYLFQDLMQMMLDIDASVSNAALDDMAALVHDADRVVVISSDFTSAAIRQFQQSMLYLHKIVDVVTDSSGDAEQLLALGARDAAIVISVHGNYARAVQSVLADAPVARALVTVDADRELVESFDSYLRLSPRETDGNRTVFSQYGVTYVLDLVYNRYLERYGA